MTNQQNWAEGVSVIVPTFKRPDGIKTALESLMSQDACGRTIEIIVADNDGAASAKSFVENFAKSAPIEVRYVHVPEPGVSSARNGAMAIKRGRFVAFLDDDMEATQTWLSALIGVATTHNASVVFGPIDAKMPHPNDALNQYMQPFFSRNFEGPDGVCSEAFGMGGCFIDLNKCDMPVPPFNTDLNEVGGEDDWLFSYLQARGMTMAWASKAMTFEHVPEGRLSLEYFWNRNFAFGQGPTQIEADKGLKGSIGVLKWMMIGAVQTVIFGPIYKVLKWRGKPNHIIYHAKVAQGAGKVLWWDGFSPRMYGAASAENRIA
jgi:succinoglycan biosynthesis protein ExoM